MKKIYEAARKEGLGIFYISPLDNDSICNYCNLNEECKMKKEYGKEKISLTVCTFFELDKRKAVL
jgi:hypothetical protein